MEGLGWFAGVMIAFLGAALSIALIAAIVRYARRRVSPRAPSSNEASAADAWPPPPTGAGAQTVSSHIHLSPEPISKTRSLYLIPILAMWGIFVVGTSFAFAGYGMVAILCRIIYGVLGLHLVTRDDTPAKVNGGLILFIVVRHIVRSV